MSVQPEIVVTDPDPNIAVDALIVDQPFVAENGPSGADLTSPKPHRRWWQSVAAATSHGIMWVFGFICMIIGLAVLATIPFLQFLSLGYLLEVSGRIARTGRLRSGLIGMDRIARIGSLILGTSLAMVPVWFVSSLTFSSLLINGPGGPTTAWQIGLIACMVLTVGHVVWAWFRGGRFRDFLWPAPVRFIRTIRRGHFFQNARDATYEFIERLRLPYYFMLGLRGFAGAIIWLFVPVTLIALATMAEQPLGTFLGLTGSLALAVVVMYLPFLQTRFAVANDFRMLFDIKGVRSDFRRAPLAFWIALFCTLLFALPLYILKAELIPREAAWLPSLVFVVFMYPSRLMTGWAVARANRRDMPRHFIFRWTSRLGVLPVALFYVGFVFLTQYVSWYGRWSLYEQHAFLLPVPFLGM